MADIETNELLLPDEVVEQLFLKKVYTDDSYALLAKEVYDERFFSDHSIPKILNILLAYKKNYHKVPSRDTLGLLLKKLSEKDVSINLEDCLNVFDKSIATEFSNNEAFIQNNVINFIKQKGLYFAIVDNLDILEKKGDISKVVSKFNTIVNVSLDTDLGFDYFKDFQKHIDHIKNPLNRIKTGFRDMDFLLGGGLLKDGNCLYVPLGRPGLGKSALLSNIAVNAMMQNLFPLIITLELSEQIYLSRIDAHISEIEINSISKNSEEVIDKIEKFKSKYNHSKLIVKEYAASSINAGHIESYLNKLLGKGLKPDIIMVDYIGLMLPKFISKGGTYVDFGNVTKELRGISKTYKAPMIAPHQVGRSNNGYEAAENTNMGHTADSAGINNTSDVITAHYQTKEMAEQQLIGSVFLKNRLAGNVGKVVVNKFSNTTLRISDHDQTGFMENQEENIRQQLGGTNLEELN